MRVAAEFTVTSRGSLAKAIANIQRATRGPKNVDVGLVAGQTPPDVAAYAIYNHEGTSRGIPSRPFVKIAFHTHHGQAKAALGHAMRAVVHGAGTFAAHLEKIGTAGEGWIRDTIDQGVPPALNPNTIRQKGSAQILVETGRMRGSVSHKVT